MKATDLFYNIRNRAQEIGPSLVEVRRDLHSHPELSNREFRTSEIVAVRLKELGLSLRTGVEKTGVVGLLAGIKPGPTVAIRADLDALPIQETLDVPYK